MSAVHVTLSAGEGISCRRQQWTSAASGTEFDTVTAYCGSISLQGDAAEMTRLRDELIRVIGDADPGAECVRRPACGDVEQPGRGEPR